MNTNKHSLSASPRLRVISLALLSLLVCVGCGTVQHGPRTCPADGEALRAAGIYPVQNADGTSTLYRQAACRRCGRVVVY